MCPYAAHQLLCRALDVLPSLTLCSSDCCAGVSEGNSGGGVDANIVQPGSTVSGDRWMAAQQAAGGEGSQAAPPGGVPGGALAPAKAPRKPGVMLPVGSAAYIAQERALIALLESILTPPAPAAPAAGK